MTYKGLSSFFRDAQQQWNLLIFRSQPVRLENLWQTGTPHVVEGLPGFKKYL